MEPDLIVFFDGECHLCDGAVRFLLDRDPDGIFHFASLQSDYARDFLPRHGLDDPNLDSLILYKRGEFYVLSDAVLELAREMRGLWPALTIFKGVPKSWRHRVYRWVARNRYRWFGKRDACRMPRPGERERFLG
jgi:predicted DCC family thiol-disulfide oxidoreductase YuxK